MWLNVGLMSPRPPHCCSLELGPNEPRDALAPLNSLPQQAPARPTTGVQVGSRAHNGASNCRQLLGDGHPGRLATDHDRRVRPVGLARRLRRCRRWSSRFRHRLEQYWAAWAPEINSLGHTAHCRADRCSDSSWAIMAANIPSNNGATQCCCGVAASSLRSTGDTVERSV